VDAVLRSRRLRHAKVRRRRAGTYLSRRPSSARRPNGAAAILALPFVLHERCSPDDPWIPGCARGTSRHSRPARRKHGNLSRRPRRSRLVVVGPSPEHVHGDRRSRRREEEPSAPPPRVGGVQLGGDVAQELEQRRAGIILVEVGPVGRAAQHQAAFAMRGNGCPLGTERAVRRVPPTAPCRSRSMAARASRSTSQLDDTLATTGAPANWTFYSSAVARKAQGSPCGRVRIYGWVGNPGKLFPMSPSPWKKWSQFVGPMPSLGPPPATTPCAS
jgi:hypothetical protein